MNIENNNCILIMINAAVILFLNETSQKTSLKSFPIFVSQNTFLCNVLINISLFLT